MTEQHIKDLNDLKSVMKSQGDGYDYKMVETMEMGDMVVGEKLLRVE